VSCSFMWVVLFRLGFGYILAFMGGDGKKIAEE